MASSNNLDALFADGELPFGNPARTAELFAWIRELESQRGTK